MKSKLIVFHQDVLFWGKSRKCHIQFLIVPKNVIAIGPAETMSHSNKFKTCATHDTGNSSGFQPNLWPYISYFTNYVSTIIIDFPSIIFQIVWIKLTFKIYDYVAKSFEYIFFWIYLFIKYNKSQFQHPIWWSPNSIFICINLSAIYFFNTTKYSSMPHRTVVITV